jgi:hypothetical protein
LTSTSLRGNIEGASLHLVILDHTGKKLVEAQGGLELLLRMVVVGEKGARVRDRYFDWESRPDLFRDEANVREGVSIALAPLLPPLPVTKE